MTAWPSGGGGARLLRERYPYAERFGVADRLAERGRDPEAVLRELREIAAGEDRPWRSGKYSGSMYSGDADHYDFLNEAFSLFSHVNALQRDTCPSATRFEGEIVAMALDLMHADSVGVDGSPCGSVTAGGTESIVTALLAYRESARERGIQTPQIIKPETAHVAFAKGAHLLGMEVVEAPVDAVTTRVDVDFVAAHVGERTAALVGSAGNYPYGTVDPIARLSELAIASGVGLHVDGCLGGFILPWGEELGYDVPAFDFRLPGVTSISLDTHKYGYALKGSSVVLFRHRDLRRRVYYLDPRWSGGSYASPGLAGSRSAGSLAAAWASLVKMGREGFRRQARAIFEASFAMQEAVRAHSVLRILGDPTFCFSFTSDELDIRLVDTALRERGWRLNGLQHPEALHMCVTRLQTQPGVVEAFARDLGAAVTQSTAPRRRTAIGRAVYAGVAARGPEDDEATRRQMVDFLDATQEVPEVETKGRIP